MNKVIKYSLMLILVFLVLLNIEKTIAEEENKKFIIIPEKYQIIGIKLFEYDKGYLIISNLFSDTELDSFTGVTNINKNGTILWNKILGRKAPDNWIEKVLYIPDQKSFILLGTVNYKFYYGGRGSGWIFMINENGRVLWDKEIKEGEITHIVDGFVDNNNLFVVGNVYNSKEEESFKNSFLMKMGMNGRIVFSKNYPFKIDLIEKISDKEFLIAGLNQNVALIGLVGANGDLIKRVELDYILDKKTTKFILMGKRLLIISLPEKEQLSVKFLDLNNPNISIKDKKLKVKDLCSLLNFKVTDDKTAIFSGKSCKDKLGVKTFKISFWDDNIRIEEIKDINLRGILNGGELLDASYDGNISVGTLSYNKIWIYRLGGFSDAKNP